MTSGPITVYIQEPLKELNILPHFAVKGTPSISILQVVPTKKQDRWIDPCNDRITCHFFLFLAKLPRYLLIKTNDIQVRIMLQMSPSVGLERIRVRVNTSIRGALSKSISPDAEWMKTRHSENGSDGPTCSASCGRCYRWEVVLVSMRMYNLPLFLCCCRINNSKTKRWHFGEHRKQVQQFDKIHLIK